MHWAAVLVTTAALSQVSGLAAQARPSLVVERGDGSSETVTVQLDRGYAAVRLSLLDELGWTVAEEEGAIVLSAVNEIAVSMRVGSPFFRWDGVVLQMANAPYRAGAQAYVPLQFFTDFLPRRLPGLYDYTGEDSLLRAGELSLLGDPTSGVTQVTPGVERAVTAPEMPSNNAEAGVAATAVAGAAVAESEPEVSMPADTPPEVNSPEAVLNAGPSAYDGTRVVVIDAGHGGADPGALGLGGAREKTVALGVALLLAERLRAEPDLEVVMIRDDDTFVDIWERGQIATEAKGERPGIFVSVHANSFPARREARGFETYFLSDARTEHERRVSAIENAPLSMNQGNGDEEQLADIDFILRDLKNYDHAHWSESLATLVQEELNDFHPGPNRGVKQGVLAVLTNALMPAVLVELGYLSNAAEARLLAEEDFHSDSARAIGDAVLRFFERYPPGTGSAPEVP
jgi:N-acetylmuramoyl-L-alanine amidase